MGYTSALTATAVLLLALAAGARGVEILRDQAALDEMIQEAGPQTQRPNLAPPNPRGQQYHDSNDACQHPFPNPAPTETTDWPPPRCTLGRPAVPPRPPPPTTARHRHQEMAPRGAAPRHSCTDGSHFHV
jgi:hypothetical protein